MMDSIHFSDDDRSSLTKEDKDRNVNKSPGCVITKEDIPLVVVTVACFVTFLIYGACNGSLGAALPELAAHYNRTEEEFGIVFSTRGSGYLMGTLSAAAVIEFPKTKIPKIYLVCLSIGIMGLTTGIIPFITSFPVVLFLFCLQGIGAGGVDTYANCLLPEIWGHRVAPWMQGMHSFFGLGAVIGPAFVGSIGYHNAFILIAFLSVIPYILIFIYKLIEHNNIKYQAILLESASEHSNNNNRTNRTINNETETDTTDESSSIKTNESILLEQSSVTIAHPIVNIAPLSVRLLTFLFFIVYVGAETGYGAWITTYALERHVTDSEEQAAYVSAYFWTALTFGRLVAIPIAIVTTTTFMMRMQMALCVISSILIVLFSSTSYASIILVSFFYGYALSSIFPLLMTFLTDYGFTM